MSETGSKARIRYVCPECGEESLCVSDDVTLYWDKDAQEWVIGGDGYPDDQSYLYCGNCDANPSIKDCKQVIL